MNEIAGGSPFDRIRREDGRGEFWTGRDLQPLMDYASWEKFAAVIEKAKASLALVQGAAQAEHHFAGWESDGGRWGNRALEDFRLTRFGAYLTAMAGDDTKRAVAEARVYFAVRTREAEVAPRVLDPAALSRSEILRIALAAEEERLALEAKVVELVPRAAQADHFRQSEGLAAIADFANDLALWAREELGIKRVLHNDVRDFLGEIGLLIRGNTVRNNQPTADAIKRDLMRPHHSTYSTNTRGEKSTTSARFTPKGWGYAWDRATRRLADHGSLKPAA